MNPTPSSNAAFQPRKPPLESNLDFDFDLPFHHPFDRQPDGKSEAETGIKLSKWKRYEDYEESEHDECTHDNEDEHETGMEDEVSSPDLEHEHSHQFDFEAELADPISSDTGTDTDTDTDTDTEMEIPSATVAVTPKLEEKLEEPELVQVAIYASDTDDESNPVSVSIQASSSPSSLPTLPPSPPRDLFVEYLLSDLSNISNRTVRRNRKRKAQPVIEESQLSQFDPSTSTLITWNMPSPTAPLSTRSTLANLSNFLAQKRQKPTLADEIRAKNATRARRLISFLADEEEDSTPTPSPWFQMDESKSDEEPEPEPIPSFPAELSPLKPPAVEETKKRAQRKVRPKTAYFQGIAARLEEVNSQHEQDRHAHPEWFSDTETDTATGTDPAPSPNKTKKSLTFHETTVVKPFVRDDYQSFFACTRPPLSSTDIYHVESFVTKQQTTNESKSKEADFTAMDTCAPAAPATSPPSTDEAAADAAADADAMSDIIDTSESTPTTTPAPVTAAVAVAANTISNSLPTELKDSTSDTLLPFPASPPSPMTSTLTSQSPPESKSEPESELESEPAWLKEAKLHSFNTQYPRSLSHSIAPSSAPIASQPQYQYPASYLYRPMLLIVQHLDS